MESAAWVELSLFFFMLGPSNIMLTSASNEFGTDLDWQFFSKDQVNSFKLNIHLRTICAARAK